jgi:SAM-dependent methyltransferase
MEREKQIQRMDARARQRVKEAITCLRLAGHDVKLGFLLDLGCGFGFLGRHFLKFGIEVVGVEISRKNIRQAKKNVPNGTFVLADGGNLPFREGIFSTVILNDVLEHVPYSLADLLLRDVKRILEAAGKLYISVANKYQIQEPHTHIPFLTWFPRPFWNAIHKIVKNRPLIGVYYPYTISMLDKLCRDRGFSCKNYTWLYIWNKVSNVEYIGSPTARKIVKALRKLRLANQISLFAQKFSVLLFVCTKNN